MLEYALIALLTAAPVGLGWGLWRRFRRRGAKPWPTGVGVMVLTLFAAAFVLWGVWRLSSSRTFQLGGDIIARHPVREEIVALTFDDGPTPGFTDQVLTMLKEQGVRASFYLTGAELEQHPELGRRIVEAGHEVGNHTYSHPRMIGRSAGFIREQVERTDALIRDAGYAGPVYFRPPGGKKLLLLPQYLARTGRKTITFDVEPDSYPAVARTPQGIVRHVLEQTRPGSIILLHVMYPSRRTSMEAVPGIIRGLREHGYRFVTVSELLGEASPPVDAALLRAPLR